MKRTLSFCALAAAMLSLGAAAQAQTTHVVNSAGGGDFTTINAAVTAATAGDIISVVNSGSPYNEQVVLNKTLTIRAADPLNKPVITFNGGSGVGTTRAPLAGGTHKPIFTVTAENVRLEDLVVRPTQVAGDTSRRTGVIAQDNFAGLGTSFNNLVIDGCDFELYGTGATTWEHIGVLAASNSDTIKDKVTITNSRFLPGNSVAPASITDIQGYKGGFTHFGKSIRMRNVQAEIVSNVSTGWFRDIHFETMEDTFVQDNTFNTSVESNDPSGGSVRILNNRFTGMYYVADPATGNLSYDGDYLIFSAVGYTGGLPYQVVGYQDELLFIKSNAGAGIPVIIDGNIFTTRRIGINLGRSTDVLIRRNVFSTDAATDAPLPPTDFWIYPVNYTPPGAASPTITAGTPINPVYLPKRHINIDRNWFLTCCSSISVTAFNIDIVGNDFEGEDVTAVVVANELPQRGTPGATTGSAGTFTTGSPAFPDTTFTVAGNDFDTTVVAFENAFDSDVQGFDLSDNYFGSPTGPAPGQLANTTGNALGDVTATTPSGASVVNDSDGDGLLDGEEIGLYGTDPNDSDSDNDGYSDGLEVTLGYPLYVDYDPNNAAKPAAPPVDTDGDGIPDANERPGFANDPNPDANDDNVSDFYAFILTGNPFGVVTLGDVDRDGNRDNVDAVATLEVFLGIKSLTGSSTDYDVNRDGRVDNVDAVIMFNVFLGNIAYLPFP